MPTGASAQSGQSSALTLITETGQPGQVIQYPAIPGTPSTPQILPIKADLGAAVKILVNPYTTTLTAGSTDLLAFGLPS